MDSFILQRNPRELENCSESGRSRAYPTTEEEGGGGGITKVDCASVKVNLQQRNGKTRYYNKMLESNELVTNLET